MGKKQDKIIEEFEAELKAGKDPKIKDYARKHGPLDDATIGTLAMLGALYADRARMRIPKSVHDRQMKLAQDLIDGRTTEAEILEVPHPLTKEKGGISVVSLAAAGKADCYEPDALLTIDGWEKITRPFDLPDKDVFAVKLRGDSLEPLIPDGSYAVIDPKKEPHSKGLALVITLDYEACVKRISFNGSKVLLESSNPAYPPREMDKKDIRRIYPVAWVKFK